MIKITDSKIQTSNLKELKKVNNLIKKEQSKAYKALRLRILYGFFGTLIAFVLLSIINLILK